MNNTELFQRIRDMELPLGKYALFGSAPLGIRGLRECSDIDLIVNEELWREYKDKAGFEYKITENGVEHIESDDGKVEIWHDWMPWYQDPLPFIDSAEIVEGLPFVRLDRVIEWKRKYAREKDLKDIETIKKFLQIKK